MRDLQLRTKIILYTAFLVVLVISGSFLMMARVVRQQIRNQLVAEMERSQLTLQQIQKNRLHELVAYSVIASDNSTLKAAIDTFQTEHGANPQLIPQLQRTVENEARKLYSTLQADVLIITANTGEVITVQGFKQSGELLNLSRQPSVSNSLNPNPEGFEQAASLWRFNDKTYRLVSVPVLLQNIIIGTLSMGYEINEGLVRAIKTNTHSEILFYSGQRIIASTLNPAKNQELLGAIGRLNPGLASPSQIHQTELVLNGESYLALLVPLAESSGDSFVILNSIDQAMSGIMRGIKQSLVVTGTVSILLATLLAWMLSRSFTNPLMNFVTFMQGITQTGDLKKKFQSQSPNYEVDVLSRAFENMAHSLEESQTQTALFYEALRQKEFNEEKLRTLAARSRLDALISQINPHFLFNALNTLGVMIEENPASAQQLTGKLARTFRRTLQVSEKEFISLEDELHFIEDYLEIERARFGERLRVVQNIDLNHAMIPCFTLQPLIENAIKHGASPKIGTTTIQIDVFPSNRFLVLQVSDDGMGIPDSQLDHFLDNGYGLRNLIDRLKIVYSSDFSWSLKSKFQQGTTVRLELPIRHSPPREEKE
jgi:signal transduction histidine kinase